MVKNFFAAVWILLGFRFSLNAQVAYFIDGYHGGIYGHIPAWQTRFMVDKLHQYPDWKINLELEPESWDTIEVRDKAAYDAFAEMFADQSAGGRIEYVNPSYAQSYLYNISGESVIRQFYYGIRKLHQHFPGAVFTTYSSEEPCFTSALPQILRSYGFKYASLKNPETCWGGYTRAYGGELVNWIGPDGSRLTAVPRYAVEALRPGSTWETIACNNAVAYITRSFQYGIKHPVGMCLQDAGWNYGPERNDHWIKPVKKDSSGSQKIADADYGPPDGSATTHAGTADDFNTPYSPTVFETWRGYIEDRSVSIPDRDWHLSQEDVLVSLTWGGQILQRIAREVRAAENKIITTEKLAAMASVHGYEPWPGISLDEAWRTLLLSQHHDCWIVPYNNIADRPGSGITWADHATSWTGNTNHRCDSILARSLSSLSPGSSTQLNEARRRTIVRVFNSTAGERKECVSFHLPAGWNGARVFDTHHRMISSQPVVIAGNGIGKGAGKEWLAKVHVPSMGYATYILEKSAGAYSRNAEGQVQHKAASVFIQRDGTYRIETDLYSILIDPIKGGVIKSLVAKKQGHKEFVDPNSQRGFDELRGNFQTEGGFRSSMESPVQIRILENGPLQVKLEIKGQIADNPFTRILTVTGGQRRIDFNLFIDWKHNTGIGESPEEIKGNALEKPFYNDSFKLQALFPLKLSGQKVYKNAPFDVLQSRLSDTFFNSWDSIKNVVLLNWVDLTDGSDAYGMALLSDHTTSYAHGIHYPLGLTVQYSGQGVFGRNYTLHGPSELNYALIPHRRRWDKAGIWTEDTQWKEPLLAKVSDEPSVLENAPGAGPSTMSMISIDSPGWEISSMIFSGTDLQVRLFNAEGNGNPRRIYFGFKADSVRVIALNGAMVKLLTVEQDASGKHFVGLSMPRFGIRTLQFVNAR